MRLIRRLLLKIYNEIKPLVTTPKGWASFIIAWLITNGHAYILLGIGLLLNIEWCKWYGGTYLAILYLPFTPEKVITFPLAWFIRKWIFKEKE